MADSKGDLKPNANSNRGWLAVTIGLQEVQTVKLIAILGRFPAGSGRLFGLHEVLEDGTQPGRCRGLEGNRISRGACLCDTLRCRFARNEGARHCRSALASQPRHHVDSALAISEAQVAKDDVRTMRARALDSLIAGPGGDDLASPLGQQPLHGVAHGRLVIDDQRA